MGGTMGNDSIVICLIGNSLYGDDGVGSAAAKEFSQTMKSGCIHIIDCGPNPHEHAPGILLLRPSKAILVSAADTGKMPGQVESMGIEAGIAVLRKNGKSKAVMLAEYLKNMVEKVYLITVQPKACLPGRGLSPECRAALEGIREEILLLINKR
jgi:hydrogenase maturation protease